MPSTPFRTPYKTPSKTPLRGGGPGGSVRNTPLSSRRGILPPQKHAIMTTPGRTLAVDFKQATPCNEVNHQGEEGIQVAVRMRPLNSKEDGRRKVWKVLQKYSSIAQTTLEGQPLPERVTGRNFFTFDQTFGEDASTMQVYKEVAKNIVLSVVTGLNGTIFAYGQTSSGKTYTMQGAGTIQEGSDGTGGGLVHLAAKDIFDRIRNTPNRIFLVRASFLEIYNEEVRDLLTPVGEGQNKVLQIREDPHRGVFVQAQETVVTDMNSLLEVLFQGEKSRAFAATAMNERSSRSHTIFRVTIESRSSSSEDVFGSEGINENRENINSRDADGAVRVATLNLVDLAGSESVRHTGATGDRQKEGGMINTSLLTLSRVIVALGTPNQTHINFRDSKLTRILQPSLSGNARMAIVCCATPSELYLEETRSTLLFASRAKLVKTHAQVNEVLDDRSLIRRLQKELAEARRQVASSSNNSGFTNEEQVKALEVKATVAGKAADEAQQKLQRLQKSILNNRVLFGSDEIVSDSADVGTATESSIKQHKRRLSDGQLILSTATPVASFLKQEHLDCMTTLRPSKKNKYMLTTPLSTSKELDLLRQALNAKAQVVRTLQQNAEELSHIVMEKEAEKVATDSALKSLCIGRDTAEAKSNQLSMKVEVLSNELNTLQEVLKQREFDIEQAWEKMNEKIHKEESLCNTIDSLQMQISSLESYHTTQQDANLVQLSLQKKQISNLRCSLVLAGWARDNITSECKALIGEKMILNNKLSKTSDKISQLANENETLREELQREKNMRLLDQSKFHRENCELRYSLVMAGMQRDIANHKNERLQHINKEIFTDNANTNEQLTIVVEKNKKLNEYIVEHTALKEQEFSDVVTSLTATVLNAGFQRDELQKQLMRQTSRFETSRQDYMNLSYEMKELIDEHEMLLDELDSSKLRNDQICSLLCLEQSNLEKEKLVTHNHIASLKQSLMRAGWQRDNLQSTSAKLTKAQSTCESLSNKLEYVTKEFHLIKSAYERESAESVRQRNEASCKVSSLLTSLRQAGFERDLLQLQITKLSTKLEETILQQSIVEDRLKKNQLEYLAEVSTWEQKFQQVNNIATSFQEKNHVLFCTIQLAGSQRDNLLKSNSMLQLKMHGMLQELQCKDGFIIESKKENSELLNCLASERSVNENLRIEADSLKLNVDELTQATTALEMEKESVQSMLDASLESCKKFEEELQSLKAFENENSYIREENRVLHNRSNSAEQQIEEGKQQIINLESEIYQLRQEIQKSVHEASQMNQKLLCFEDISNKILHDRCYVQAAYVATRKENQSLHNNVSCLETLLSNEQSGVQSMSLVLVLLKQDRDNKIETLSTYKSRIYELERNSIEKTALIDDLQSKIKEAEANLCRLNEELKNAFIKCENYVSEQEATKETLQLSQHNVVELEKSLALLVDEKQLSDKNCLDLTFQSQEYERQVQFLVKCNEKLKEETLKCNLHLSIIQKRIPILESQIACLKSSHRDDRKKLCELANQLLTKVQTFCSEGYMSSLSSQLNVTDECQEEDVLKAFYVFGRTVIDCTESLSKDLAMTKSSLKNLEVDYSSLVAEISKSSDESRIKEDELKRQFIEAMHVRSCDKACLDDLQQKLEDAEEYAKQQMEKSCYLETELTKLSLNHTDLINKHSELTGLVETLDHEKNRLIKEKSAIFRSNDDLNKQLENFRKEISVYEQNLREKGQELKSLMNDHSTSLSKCSKLEEQCSGLLQRVDENEFINQRKQQEIILLNEKLRRSSEHVMNTESDLNRLRTQLDEEREKVEQLNKDMERRRQDSIKQQKLYEADKSNLLNEIEQLKIYNKKDEANTQRLQLELEEKTKFLQASINIKEETEKENSELKKLLSSLNEQVDEARQSAIEADAELDAKEVQLEEIMRVLAQTKAELQEYRNRSTAMNSCGELTHIKREIYELQQQLTQERDEKRKVESDLKRQMGEEQRLLIQEAEVRMNSLRQELALMEYNLKQTEEEAYAARQASEELREQQQKQATLLVETKNKLTAYENENFCMSRASQRLEAEFSSKIEALSSELKHTKAELNAAQSKIRKYENEEQLAQNNMTTKLKDDLIDLKNRNKELIFELEATKSQLADTNKQLVANTALQSQISDLKEQVSKKDERIKKLNSIKLTNDQLKKLKVLKTEHAEYKKKIEESDQQIIALQKKLVDYEQSSNSNIELSALLFERDALDKKLRRFAAHSQRLEDEKVQIRSALATCVGHEIQPDDLTKTIIRICDKVSSLEEECDALSRTQKRVASYLAEIEERKAENGRLNDEMRQFREKIDQLLDQESLLQKELNDMKNEKEALLQSIQSSVEGNGVMNQQAVKKMRQLERENLQLMLDLKASKASLQKAKADLNNARLQALDDQIHHIGHRPNSPALPILLSTSKYVSNTVTRNIDKENEQNYLQHKNSTFDKSTALPKISTPAKSEPNTSVAVPNRAPILGEAFEDTTDNTAECFNNSNVTKV